MNAESGEESWIVIGDDFLPVDPIQDYLSYLSNVGRSPNTVRTYAYHLRLYWEYLDDKRIDWTAINLEKLSEFILWLRSPDPAGVISLAEQESKRSEASINGILSAVCMLYDFHEKSGDVPHIPLYRTQMMPGRKYKGFLHHINKGKPVKARLLKLKVPKRTPKTVTNEQAKTLIDACHSVRDKFLVCLMYEGGLRIGQALGLRHEDVQSMDNAICIEPRADNVNGARSKTRDPYTVHVSKELMGLYTQYVCDEFMEILGDNLSDYVFVNLWSGAIGEPMTYSNVMDLFRRLKRKTGIAINPHKLRHTHATEAIREGMPMAYVQKRLGHASIQTTIDTYVHVTNEDMKLEHQKYLESRDDGRSTEKTPISSQEEG